MGLNEIIQLGNIIRKLREEKGVSQKVMAESIGIPYSTYSNYENNNRTPSIDTLIKIAENLGVSPEYLLKQNQLESSIKDELLRLDASTRLYIQLFEINGHSVELKNEEVRITDKSGGIYTVSEKDFMSMIHYCHVDIENNMEKLLRTYHPTK